MSISLEEYPEIIKRYNFCQYDWLLIKYNFPDNRYIFIKKDGEFRLLSSFVPEYGMAGREIVRLKEDKKEISPDDIVDDFI